VIIALDAMGGDLAPQAAVEGAVLASRELGIAVVLVGNQEIVERELKRHNISRLPLTIEHAPEVVTMDDSPLESVIAKPNSSIHRGFEMVRRGEAQGFVSAGNSGAIMTAAIMILGTIAGIDRPAIASLIPSANGFTLLLDAGANTEVKPLNLVQFAVMGSVYSRRVRQIARPRLGILANGEEDSKGTDLTRSAAATLRQMDAEFEYIGYVEGRDINRGRVDVVVTDGFTGNVALKSLEGFSSFLLGSMRELFSSSVRGRLAFFLIRNHLRTLRERLDPSEYGGAPLLGVNGVAIIAHGSSNPTAIKNAIRAAADEGLVRRVSAEIAEIIARNEIVPARPEGKGLRAILGRMRERLHLHKDAETGRHKGEESRKRGTGAIGEARKEEPALSAVDKAAATDNVPATHHKPEASTNGARPETPAPVDAESGAQASSRPPENPTR
jgi:glycerol-3-phosphate acyltransferase PlsX